MRHYTPCICKALRNLWQAGPSLRNLQNLLLNLLQSLLRNLLQSLYTMAEDPLGEKGPWRHEQGQRAGEIVHLSQRKIARKLLVKLVHSIRQHTHSHQFWALNAETSHGRPSHASAPNAPIHHKTDSLGARRTSSWAVLGTHFR